ncbi:LutB/LldF family L-lactate oxidation iron-sulfur protein [Helcobacillus sp. ACRRO]|uniref:LutB/LldF family L-lactate oxidation iron-sulfur protein n=1 Tax=Helcobacillus TaxID=1161125 RepID=UPI001EF6B9E5|nr:MULTISPECIES: LutB/LldF family L-lactate oxidation iron-sulfur protein [Helcobacillus]MCG7426417.1 LutB/LldF family L-lactate oxidation iron-sulfur protein [Helcobacillus sp. ACRRO]MDK7742370.1 LutB/LldF family L-lactate oxidation iron-sulfur protein [Helcobacillus massiliensis]WOO91994.1 LutB/LldF family L-lactate oxidation iron-sulfur protein [Helcobacillus massiliensis]
MTTVNLGMPRVRPPYASASSALMGADGFRDAAKGELQDDQLRANLAHAAGGIRTKRAKAVRELRDFQQLRSAGSALKWHVTDHLPELLEQFEEAFTAAGGTVHWARDADEANRIVTSLVRDAGSEKVLKVKSMATQEIRLNEALADAGITAVETDLAELIVQLAGDTPSHIVVPAIHRNRRQIQQLFRDHLPGAPADLGDDPQELTAAARRFLREQFLDMDTAICGANFAVAETGTLSIVESEGNGRMCLTLPSTLIAVMGIEKLIPTFQDLEVFLQLLPRSSTGERMNPYTTMFTGTRAADGPENLHIVLLDNGRSAVLSDPHGRSALHCIRCSACLNACPVYERAGGHAYGSTYPGPIGAILSPQMTGMEGEDNPNATLPYASSLCGACYDVCPVKINIPEILVHLRSRDVDERAEAGAKRNQWDAAMAGASKLMSSPGTYDAVVRASALIGRAKPRGNFSNLPLPMIGDWTQFRDLPVPRESFRSWYTKREKARRSADASNKEQK